MTKYQHAFGLQRRKLSLEGCSDQVTVARFAATAFFGYHRDVCDCTLDTYLTVGKIGLM